MLKEQTSQICDRCCFLLDLSPCIVFIRNNHYPICVQDRNDISLLVQYIVPGICTVSIADLQFIWLSFVVIEIIYGSVSISFTDDLAV